CRQYSLQRSVPCVDWSGPSEPWDIVPPPFTEKDVGLRPSGFSCLLRCQIIGTFEGRRAFGILVSKDFFQRTARLRKIVDEIKRSLPIGKEPLHRDLALLISKHMPVASI